MLQTNRSTRHQSAQRQKMRQDVIDYLRKRPSKTEAVFCNAKKQDINRGVSVRDRWMPREGREGENSDGEQQGKTSK